MAEFVAYFEVLGSACEAYDAAHYADGITDAWYVGMYLRVIADTAEALLALPYFVLVRTMERAALTRYEGVPDAIGSVFSAESDVSDAEV